MTDTKLYQVEDGWIETFTGRQFHFNDPTPDQIDLMDIAHALSLLCRYNGHTKRFYSVAEHSVLISRWLRANGHEALALTGLMHDAAEAYIGDMPRPIKVTLPAFKTMETAIDTAVATKFELFYPFPDIIKECDSRILVDERAQVMNSSPHEWGTDQLEGLGVAVHGLGPDSARDLFLREFHELTEA